MMNTAIVYYFRHHCNTKKLPAVTGRKHRVTIIDVTVLPARDPEIVCVEKAESNQNKSAWECEKRTGELYNELFNVSYDGGSTDCGQRS